MLPPCPDPKGTAPAGETPEPYGEKLTPPGEGLGPAGERVGVSAGDSIGALLPIIIPPPPPPLPPCTEGVGHGMKEE